MSVHFTATLSTFRNSEIGMKTHCREPAHRTGIFQKFARSNVTTTLFCLSGFCKGCQSDLLGETRRFGSEAGLSPRLTVLKRKASRISAHSTSNVTLSWGAAGCVASCRAKFASRAPALDVNASGAASPQ